MDDKILWAEWLNAELDKQGISRRRFAQETGISRSTIREWFMNYADVKLSMIMKTLDYLGYDIVFKKRG